MTDATAFGQLLRDIDAYDTGKYNNVTGLALKLLPLLAVRPYKEFAFIEPNEIDFVNARWVIPAERMKEREAHMVPLSRQALELFRQLRNINGNRKYLFTLGDGDKPMARTTLGAVLHSLGYKGKHCPHGSGNVFQPCPTANTGAMTRCGITT